ncbi:IclR family transcriptional regulator [Geminisphaera colitermitum]|uniref:IclR family transcriptional regulator n=1 Tax=Geminisphaera colitermitum TaxID=1148786 RepID=UPI0007DC38D5|nr:helix-turn-helix domain-containing protein [Geminisphaera colitermitum]
MKLTTKAVRGENPKGGVQSLQRGLAILERVSQAEDGVTLARLAELTGMKKTTVHNLARTLLDEGYLARWTQPVRYGPGPALAALGGRSGMTNALHAAAGPLLVSLAREFPGSAALLAEASGTEVRVTLRVSPEVPGEVERPVDRLSPPYISATSLVFLAMGGEAWREVCMQRYPFSDYGAPLWGTVAALEAQLARVREERGVVLQKAGAGIAPMAVPVSGARGEVLASLGLAFRCGAKGPGVALERLRDRARELGARFGGGA